MNAAGWRSWLADVWTLLTGWAGVAAEYVSLAYLTLAVWLGLTPAELGALLVQGAAALIIGGFFLRSAFIITGRAFGFYHPAHYRVFPRLVPWRSVVKVRFALSRWYERVALIGQRGPSGGFASALAVLCQIYRPGQVLLGRASAWGFGLLQSIGQSVERHLLLLAMTGAGKTVLLTSILSCWKNSAFVIDPKGQITRALARHDPRRWVVLDPYGITDEPAAIFNPFDCLAEAEQRDAKRQAADGAAVLWALRIAEAIVITPPGSRTPFFTDTARAMMAGIILHLYSAYPPEFHNLPAVRDLITGGLRMFDDDGAEMTQGDEAHALLLREMTANPAYEGAIAGAAAAMMNAGGETGGNLRATLQDSTKFLDIPAVRAMLRGRSSLNLSDLKTRDDVVLSFCAPVLSIREELGPLSRFLTNMTTYTFEAVPQKNGQCLCVIDELPAQGHNSTFEVMLAVARSYGQTVLAVAQNIELLKKAYPNSWGSFIGEADAVYWMASNHHDTTEYLAKTLGRKTLSETDPQTGHVSRREVNVMDSDQVRRFLSPQSGNMIVTRAGGRAMKLKTEPYFKALPVWAYAPDRDHKENWRRRLGRLLFDWRGKRVQAAPKPPRAMDASAHAGEPDLPADAVLPAQPTEPSSRARAS